MKINYLAHQYTYWNDPYHFGKVIGDSITLNHIQAEKPDFFQASNRLETVPFSIDMQVLE